MNYDLIIIGAGPAGIFTALELVRNHAGKKILMVEKGKPVDKRHCPKEETGKCMNCKPNCMITTGFSGAGAFSDGKLSLSCEVGGELPSLIGEDFAQELIDYTDKIYLEFGADEHVEGVYKGEEIDEIRKRAIRAGLRLVDCPIRHLGTEKAQKLYLNIQNYLADQGVEMLFGTECENILLEGDTCTGGRGADWLERSVRRTVSPISRGRWISAFGWSAEMRSWRWSTRSSMRENLSAIRSPGRIKSVPFVRIPEALWLRRITTMTWPSSTDTATKI